MCYIRRFGYVAAISGFQKHFINRATIIPQDARKQGEATLNIDITRVKQSKLGNVNMKNLGFGEVFSDYMLIIDYVEGRWQTPQILPFGEISILPSLCMLHYGQGVFEGLKVFYSKHGGLNIFRPQKYHERMNKSCRQLCIPECYTP